MKTDAFEENTCTTFFRGAFLVTLMSHLTKIWKSFFVYSTTWPLKVYFHLLRATPFFISLSISEKITFVPMVIFVNIITLLGNKGLFYVHFIYGKYNEWKARSHETSVLFSYNSVNDVIWCFGICFKIYATITSYNGALLVWKFEVNHSKSILKKTSFGGLLILSTLRACLFTLVPYT